MKKENLFILEEDQKIRLVCTSNKNCAFRIKKLFFEFIQTLIYLFGFHLIYRLLTDWVYTLWEDSAQKRESSSKDDFGFHFYFVSLKDECV